MPGNTGVPDWMPVDKKRQNLLHRPGRVWIMSPKGQHSERSSYLLMRPTVTVVIKRKTPYITSRTDTYRVGLNCRECALESGYKILLRTIK